MVVALILVVPYAAGVESLLRENLNSKSTPMPSPDSALKNFSAVVITGGSSGIGKSYIELLAKLRPELAFCNLSRRKPDIINSKA
jgi:NADPH:quinone reductase-like Zn-dependent oxidoreductase